MYRLLYLGGAIFPMVAASTLMGPFLFSSCYMGGVLLFFFSCFWGFSGLAFSLIAACIFVVDAAFLSQMSLLLFLGISTCSSFIAASLDAQIEEIGSLEQKRLMTLLEEAKEDLALAASEIEALEKKSLLKDLEESVDQKHLLELLQKAQKHSLDLEQEVKNLEEMITSLSLFPVAKVPKKKNKEDTGQSFFALEF